MISSIMLALKLFADYQFSYWQIFIPLFVASGLNLYFLFIIFIRTMIESRQFKSACVSSLFNTLRVLMVAIFEVLLCHKIDGDYEKLGVAVQSTYGVVFMPIWLLMTAFGFQACRIFLKTNAQILLTIVGVFVGIAVGFALRNTNPSQKAIDLIGFPGEILMNMLKMMILPLIVGSLISGLSQIDAKQSGKIGIVSLCYYTVTLTLSVVTGIAMVLLIHPGNPDIKNNVNSEGNTGGKEVDTLDKVLDLIRNMFPENIIETMFSQVETVYVENTKEGNVTELTKSLKTVNGINVLGIIVFSITLGIVISAVGEEARPLMKIFVALDIVITRIVTLMMWYAPIGIASLIAKEILEINNLAETAKMLGLYMATVIAGLAIHLFFTEPLIYFLASRKNPFIFLKGMIHAAATALGTSSSAASLPVTFRCLEENNHVDPMYTKFVLPVGAMVNMDGTALYEAVATIFIAQLNGRDLNFGHLLIICVTAMLASIGAASIPSAGLVTMLMVLSAVGLPTEDISLIVAVDWLLDRLRTCVNVCGDGFGCGVVEAICTRLGVKPSKDVENNSNSHPETSSYNSRETVEQKTEQKNRSLISISHL
ncbi:hypothetical protein FO519_006682 [Halicephalobus sp. NKZ332]|nr:hypothetical protein FO519_006682 [Halicephalobus sp. NKZ332]